MGYCLNTILIFLITLSFLNINLAEQYQPKPCPCSLPEYCKPITKIPNIEVFGFAESFGQNYKYYDWSQLTTIAWRTDPEFVCYAHERGARAVFLAQSRIGGRDFDVEELNNSTWRAEWIEEQVQFAIDKFLDGINFDAEREAFSNDPFTQLYAQLVAETAQEFHIRIPGSQVSVDIPWSPYGVDNRYYDWIGLANAADILFVMAYDMQSQIWGRCVASANSPPALINKGIQQFIVELGISPKKTSTRPTLVWLFVSLLRQKPKTCNKSE
eukprot:TRINITY_DN8984_c0_g1_i4.p1 TRINITY_DN8984_c0_g1~~TRINITY_DN8984_c0_g1_i4.p1  ORF type:complete len:270 (+),score=19.00 TRINITY_DN8984_c0_g1_i4:1-810(+)